MTPSDVVSVKAVRKAMGVTMDPADIKVEDDDDIQEVTEVAATDRSTPTNASQSEVSTPTNASQSEVSTSTNASQSEVSTSTNASRSEVSTPYHS